MKPVKLYFPNSSRLFDFLLYERISGVDANSIDSTVKGELSHEQIGTACNLYGAMLHTRIVKPIGS